jgi:pimeloyl-ACP methyl ester carboxylesterase
MWPLALSRIVDHPFSVVKSRADKAGLVLADAIINKAQGERPVTLIGYSMGARLIYFCLMSLAERRAFGLIESAVLISTPAPSDAGVWRAIKSVVAGRLVNVYSEKTLS